MKKSGHIAFYAAIVLIAGVVTWLTGELLLGLIVGWLIMHAPAAVLRILLEVDAAKRLARCGVWCFACERLPANPSRAVDLALPVRTRMRYRYITNSFHCPDCGACEYWASALRTRRVPIPLDCCSLADYRRPA